MTPWGWRSASKTARLRIGSWSGLAALSLLASVAQDQPLLCVVDDAQWLDVESAHVLAFVSRRLYADAVGLLLAVRDPVPFSSVFDQLPTMWLGGLPDDDARRLLASVAPMALTEPIIDRILSETAGNPLGIVELGPRPHGPGTGGQRVAAGAAAVEPAPRSTLSRASVRDVDS